MNKDNNHSLTDQQRENVDLFFKSFAKHLEIIRDGGDESNQAFRANILINQLRQFEKAVWEMGDGGGPVHVGDDYLRSLLNVKDLASLVEWLISEQRIVKIKAVFYQNENSYWERLHGDVELGRVRLKEWIKRGVLGRLEGEHEAYISYMFTQPRLVLMFETQDDSFENVRIGLATFVSKLLPLFIVSPIHQKSGAIEGNFGLIAKDRTFLELLGLIRKAAVTDVSILLEGESGTGKEVIANFIHKHSPRRPQPMVAVNCAAIPAGLMESELFGHEKGAFTGAYSRQIGQVENADGGTLFLDEIGEMELAMQAKLLRFLQLHEFHRVGGKQKIAVDVRIVAATNRNLKRQVAEGLFREDLYYRLSVMPFIVPSLRERIDDIIPLAEFFFDKYSRIFNFKRRPIDPRVLQLLAEYDFPGNVRELENLVQNILVVSQGAEIKPDHLPKFLKDCEPRGKRVFIGESESRTYRKRSSFTKILKPVLRPFSARRGDSGEMPWEVNVPQTNDELKAMKKQINMYASEMTLELERRFLRDLLDRADGSMPVASKMAGINRTLLYKMLERSDKND